ncbi:hypothetical protein vB_PsyM_KIL2_0164 [Pseudomonas phage vB_PsyM_KIL2]|uniref:Uncharacterized protein n=1 Tax=Pseudomonas phage vB_PsyM_KIL2 TaxID=1777066 RepID=A0A142IEA9_9CAUD|nr:hypothetical protein vB_PsyM_KIL2_0164 [Pseudomonas phage vB_PsyM_KIL2]
MLQIMFQFLDCLLGFPTGFDVVADSLEQWMQARDFVKTLKIIS